MMTWNTGLPREPGAYRWRADTNSRVHSVRVAIKNGNATCVCKTMDVRTVLAGGEWQLKESHVKEDWLAELSK